MAEMLRSSQWAPGGPDGILWGISKGALRQDELLTVASSSALLNANLRAAFLSRVSQAALELLPISERARRGG